MILFIGKTWFLWWILLSVFLLRWFHQVSSKAAAMGFEVPESSDEKTPAASGPISSGSASHLFV
jgi:hypothetical protein